MNGHKLLAVTHKSEPQSPPVKRLGTIPKKKIARSKACLGKESSAQKIKQLSAIIKTVTIGGRLLGILSCNGNTAAA